MKTTVATPIPMSAPVRSAPKDARFTLSREYAGYSRPRHVLRFCGDWLGSFASLPAARMARAAAIRARHAQVRAA